MQFNFHNFIGVSLRSRSARVLDFVRHEFKFFQVEQLEPEMPVVSIQFESRLFPGRSRVGFTRYVHKGLMRWDYTIAFSEDRIDIDVVCDPIAIPLVFHFLIEPAMRYLAAQRGTLMMHASCVSLHSESFVFVGGRSGGKTSVALGILQPGNQGWKMQGDDKVFLTGKGQTFSYLTRPQLGHSNTIQEVPGLRDRLSITAVWQVRLFSLVRRVTRDRLKGAYRLALEGPSVAIHPSAAQAKALLFLAYQSKMHPAVLTIAPSSENVERLMTINAVEVNMFRTLVRKSGCVPDYDVWWQTWQAAERRTLENWIGHVPVYTVSLPDLDEDRPGYYQKLRKELLQIAE